MEDIFRPYCTSTRRTRPLIYPSKEVLEGTSSKREEMKVPNSNKEG
jgi:hypothetical protein